MKVIILAGGSGTRLFPLSRKNYPKQFLRIGDEESFFQKTVRRTLKAVSPEDVVIVTNRDYRFLIRDQLREMGLDPEKPHLLMEPVGRNTAPAIGLAAKFVRERLEAGDEEVLFVCPSDHLISPLERFANYMREAEKIAREGHIVTFGVRPSRPEIGYGYIEAEEGEGAWFRVRRFHEKPDFETARRYLKAGNFFWNSGMFAFTVETIWEELARHAPEIHQRIEGSWEEVLRNFFSLPDISIDYAVMEKTDRAVVLPLEVEWSDVGSWEAVWEVLPKDERGNAKTGRVWESGTRNSLILGNTRLVAVLGLEDVMVVETDDVLLVARKGEGQRVRELVKSLKDREDLRPLTECHTTVHRPWGSYTELERGERYRIKRITVNPGETLSLQRHYHRSEHWVVVKGTAKVVLEDEEGNLREYFVHENESIYVPKTTKHRLVNPGKVPLEIIEVQVGEYVEEDDIERFEDKYGRS